MTSALQHRGPDAQGVWSDAEAGIALGHRRLSILDLSAAGSQPMHSTNERYVIAFNGEIYNFADLRGELEAAGFAPSWRGHSDTEVFLAAITAWGVAPALRRAVGMFAFALWDRETRRLILARDRVGEKPLYYGRVGEALLVGSELKSLSGHPRWKGEIDRGSVALFLRHGYVPTPYSIYRGIRKLEQGCYVEISAQGAQADLAKPTAYWSAREIAGQVPDTKAGMDPEASVDKLDQLLRNAVKRQMVADVPLGAFLSGGIDSSTVVALMQAQSSRPVKTFTIGFHEKGYDEAEHAKAVARHLGTEHTELYVTAREAMDVIPLLPAMYDEPFADSSQIPTHLVAKLARSQVTVALSGDGGDELFGGYNRYAVGHRLWRRTSVIPLPLRRAAASLIRPIPPRQIDRAYALFAPLLPQRLRHGQLGDKLHKFADMLRMESAEAMYHSLVSYWREPDRIVIGGREHSTVLSDPSRWPATQDFTHRMMYLDLVSYLPDDILVKVDRAAMAVSLETRIPLLDHHVIEFAWQLPLELKIRAGQTKWILRRVLDRYVPASLIERPKMGFGVPIDSWLRGPLREWAESLLDPVRLADDGIFEVAPIRATWQEHLAGSRNWQYLLWAVLMFQAWLCRSESVR